MNRRSNLKVGQVFDGKVTKANSFGVFVEIAPHIEGLLHVSNMTGEGINEQMKILRNIRVGQTIRVSIKFIDDCGRIGLSQTTE